MQPKTNQTQSSNWCSIAFGNWTKSNQLWVGLSSNWTNRTKSNKVETNQTPSDLLLFGNQMTLWSRVPADCSVIEHSIEFYGQPLNKLLNVCSCSIGKILLWVWLCSIVGVQLCSLPSPSHGPSRFALISKSPAHTLVWSQPTETRSACGGGRFYWICQVQFIKKSVFALLDLLLIKLPNFLIYLL